MQRRSFQVASVSIRSYLFGGRQFSTVSVSLVKELRSRTGAPIVDCRDALAQEEVGGDMKLATEWLRKKGLASAAKKVGRSATEGFVGIASAGDSAAIVEVNSETDFVARNEVFQTLVMGIAESALALPATNAASVSDAAGTENNASEALKSLPIKNDEGAIVGDAVSAIAAKVGENVVLRRALKLSFPGAVIGTYVHKSSGNGSIGASAAIVALKAADGAVADAELARKLAMHVVAGKPSYLSADTIPADVLGSEKALLLEQMGDSDKPANVLEKIVTGRLGKFYKEVCLLEQPYLIGGDGKQSVGKVLEGEGGVTLVGYARFSCGESMD